MAVIKMFVGAVRGVGIATGSTASAIRRVLAAAGVTVGIAGLALLGGTGIAAADGTKPDTGSYDELFGVEKPSIHSAPITGTHYGQEGSYDDLLNILDGDGFQADRP